MNAQVDQFILEEKRWPCEISLLRKIALDHNLEESFKWKTPVYSLNDKNILVLTSLRKEFYKAKELKTVLAACLSECLDVMDLINMQSEFRTFFII